MSIVLSHQSLVRRTGRMIRGGNVHFGSSKLCVCFKSDKRQNTRSVELFVAQVEQRVA